MKNNKKIGIWMDHATAYLLEFSSEIHQTKTISCDFTFHDKVKTLQRSENEMHNKEQQKQLSFYKTIENEIKNFDEILLFGPTHAKTELYNHLKKNHIFDHLKIECKNTDKMTENEQHKFVSSYFKRHEFKM
jgi:stalled ribosome rescue protein Dom34